MILCQANTRYLIVLPRLENHFYPANFSSLYKNLVLLSCSSHSYTFAYCYYLPYIALAWRRIGFEPKLYDYSVFMTFDEISTKETFIIIGDVDLLPITRRRFEINTNHTNYILAVNAYCCPNEEFSYENFTNIHYYPMSYVGMRKALWKEIFLPLKYCSLSRNLTGYHNPENFLSTEFQSILFYDDIHLPNKNDSIVFIKLKRLFGGFMTFDEISTKETFIIIGDVDLLPITRRRFEINTNHTNYILAFYSLLSITVPIYSTINFTYYRYFNEILCRIEGFNSFLCGCSCMLAYIVLSVNRYLLLYESNQNFFCRYSTIICWLLSLSWTLPPVFDYMTSYVPEGLGFHCSIKWNNLTRSNRFYILFSFIFIYFIPLFILITVNILLQSQ
ncbi:hypothetical protein I4U23_008920 [Adineta vaga]|nr:hypothetical protein I4U23_008920 [Adineta vaga]